MSEKYITPRDGLFLVSRTSAGCDEKPCDEAIGIEVKKVDRRTTDDPAKIRAYGGKSDWWYSEGTNHRVENGQIVRDMGTEMRWAVQIDDVMAFVRQHGTCVVCYERDGFASLEIYDGYRE